MRGVGAGVSVITYLYVFFLIGDEEMVGSVWVMREPYITLEYRLSTLLENLKNGAVIFLFFFVFLGGG